MQKLSAIFGLLLFVTVAFAQDPLAGRWEGKIQSMQGERDTVVIFKKDGDNYTGRSTGLRPGSEMQIREVKIDGANVTAKADVETPQTSFIVNYKFTLQGETLKGQGGLDFNGQAITFDLDLKRVSADTTGSVAPAAAAGQNRQQRQPASSDQPQQKQGLDYFAGQWNFRYVGRDTALAPAPREGTITFTKAADGKSLNAVIEGNNTAGAYKETANVVYDEATKTITFNEKLANGLKVTSKGDWSSPIAIRFNIEPIKIKGSALQVRRIISIVAAHSFTLTEDVAENGSGFVRLGNAIYTRK